MSHRVSILARRIRRAALPLWLRIHGVEAHGIIWVNGTLPHIKREPHGRIVLGDGCVFGTRVSLAAFDGALLEIGPHVTMNHTGGGIAAYRLIEIGADTQLGSDVVIIDDSFHDVSPARPRRRDPIRIGRNVWLNPGVRVMPGAEIGDHTVIGAGAVVTKSIPARCFAAGVPARIVARFECADDWRRA